MSSLIQKLRSQSVQEPNYHQPPEDLSWRPINKSLILLRTVNYKGVNFQCFFVHTPTIFKTRGKYKLIEDSDKEGMVNFKNEFKDFYCINFRISDSGVLYQNNKVPFIQLLPDSNFEDVYYEDNTLFEINDLLDLLDFLTLLEESKIVLNPLSGIEKLQYYIDNLEGFRLSTLESYCVDVKNFTTSREKPTLNYPFILLGEEEVDGETKVREKFFTYTIVNEVGSYAVDKLEIMVKDTKQNEYYVMKYIKHLIKGGINRIKGNLYFVVDTTLLKPIRTIQELPLNIHLVREREQARVVLRSLTEFKKVIKKLSERTGTPIKEYEGFVVDTDHSDKDFRIKSKLVYKNANTVAADKKFKDFLEAANIGGNYLEKLIEKYLAGNTSPEFVERHIEASDRVFKVPILNEALKALFICIPGKKNLKEMYEEAKKYSKSVNYLSNSLKLRLHVFGLPESEEYIMFIKRVLSSLAKVSINQQGIMGFDYEVESEEGYVEIKASM